MKSRLHILSIGVAGIALLAFVSIDSHAPKIVFNGSASAPVGFYLVGNGDIKRGDLLLITPPRGVRNLIVERRYLPPEVPLIKRVVAISGDLVCRNGLIVFVNGKLVASALKTDGKGRPMPVWSGCRRLDNDEIFVLQSHLRSFDSRYFGPITQSLIVGEATLLWRFDGKIIDGEAR